MSKIVWNGGTLLAPVPPTLVSCGDFENANIMTVAWTGIINTIPPKTYISVRPRRHSYNLIKESGEFVINLPTAELVRKVDYCGIYTGAKVNKFDKCEFTKAKASKVSCPLIEECPINLECRVTKVIQMETHDMFIADIVAVNVDDRLVNKQGKLCMERADLLAYAHSEYYTLGKRIGKMGFSATKPKKKKKQISK